MPNKNMKRLAEIIQILYTYPVELVQGYRSDLVIQLKEGTIVSDNDRARLNELSAFDQSTPRCWEVFL